MMDGIIVSEHVLRDDRGVRRPSALTLASSTGSTGNRSAEPSPTRSRFTETTEPNQSVQQGPFVFVGPGRKRFHAERIKAPYPLPCGLEELSRCVICLRRLI